MKPPMRLCQPSANFRRPSFSARHYRQVAETLATARHHTTSAGQFERIVGHFVSTFQVDNPNFDRERFLTWCYAKVRS